MSKFTLPDPPARVTVRYADLCGVDLSSEQRSVAPQRASYAQNMYKKYVDGYSNFVETRPGIQTLGGFGGRIYGMYFWGDGPAARVLVHAGTGLYLWDSFPSAPGALSPLCEMAARRSSGFLHGDRLYINDGRAYLCFDGTSCAPVEGYVPTTSIARTPAGGGTAYQAVNLLTGRRKNSFRGDGASREYHLDAAGLDDSAVTAEVDGEPTTAFAVDRQTGVVTFTTAPAAPGGGDDNVVITFAKTAAGYADRIAGCTQTCAFDGRVFFTGNADYPNVLWHSELDNPAYIPDVNYYQDGDASAPVASIVVQDGSLIVLKNTAQHAPAVFSHAPALDYELGRVYPVSESVISVGNVSPGAAISFRDDLVYLSAFGLEGISYPNVTAGQRILCHRSTVVDSALRSEDLSSVMLEEWDGYLCLLCGGRLFLADSRGRYGTGDAYEYEWFLWTGIGARQDGAFSPACYIKEYGGVLYIGTDQGAVCRFSGTSDDGCEIESVWETRMETAGDTASRKTAHRRGAAVLLKTIPNSRVDISVSTDRVGSRPLVSVNMGGLDFAGLDFGALSFSTDSDNVVAIPLREKYWKTLKLRLSSARGFGLGSICYRASVINYVK